MPPPKVLQCKASDIDTRVGSGVAVLAMTTSHGRIEVSTTPEILEKLALRIQLELAVADEGSKPATASAPVGVAPAAAAPSRATPTLSDAQRDLAERSQRAYEEIRAAYEGRPLYRRPEKLAAAREERRVYEEVDFPDSEMLLPYDDGHEDPPTIFDEYEGRSRRTA